MIVERHPSGRMMSVLCICIPSYPITSDPMSTASLHLTGHAGHACIVDTGPVTGHDGNNFITSAMAAHDNLE
jgi:hypothetical protein